jgi:membrane-bound ClpP family serine protease
MCHLLLLLPILALPVFWVWPLAVAGPTYAAIVSAALVTYAYAVKAMRQPVETGTEEMLHSTGYVVDGPDADSLWVRVHNERWLARTTQSGLHKGDRVRVVGMEGMTLLVVLDSEE